MENTEYSPARHVEYVNMRIGGGSQALSSPLGVCRPGDDGEEEGLLLQAQTQKNEGKITI